MKGQQDVYGEPQIFKFPGMTVRVYRPILTDEERARRMKEIEKAAAALLISEYERKRRNEKKNGRLHSSVADADRQ